MFTSNTTLVLGAGASAQFGFPLGKDVHKSLIYGIGRLLEEAQQEKFPRISHSIGTQNVEAFNRQPLKALVSYLTSPLARKLLPSDFPHDSVPNLVFDFYEALDRQTFDTLDRFIRDNPRHNFLGKVLLAHQILLRMYEHDDQQMCLRSFAKREYDERRNWYQQLTNLIREGSHRKPASIVENNRLCVVTFNYDLSLEQALSTSLADTEIHQGIDYRDVVEILHVNGGPTDLPDVVTNVGKFVLESAQDIHLVDEDVANDGEEVRARARSAIENSARIYVMGFHFDPSNVSTIGLSDTPTKGRIFCLNFDGYLGVKQKMLQLGIPIENISAGSPNEPLFIDQALENGFLEQ